MENIAIVRRSCHCRRCPRGILLHRGRVDGFEPIIEGSDSLWDLVLKSGEIHRLMIFMVKAGSTIVVRWIFYAQAYVLSSTGAWQVSREGVCVSFFPEIVDYNVAGGRREGMRVQDAGECGICSCGGHHGGHKNDRFSYVSHRRNSTRCYLDGFSISFWEPICSTNFYWNNNCHASHGLLFEHKHDNNKIWHAEKATQPAVNLMGWWHSKRTVVLLSWLFQLDNLHLDNAHPWRLFLLQHKIVHPDFAEWLENLCYPHPWPAPVHQLHHPGRLLQFSGMAIWIAEFLAQLYFGMFILFFAFFVQILFLFLLTY